MINFIIDTLISMAMSAGILVVITITAVFVVSFVNLNTTWIEDVKTWKKETLAAYRLAFLMLTVLNLLIIKGLL